MRTLLAILAAAAAITASAGPLDGKRVHQITVTEYGHSTTFNDCTISVAESNRIVFVVNGGHLRNIKGVGLTNVTDKVGSEVRHKGTYTVVEKKPIQGLRR